jgi:hypothetical protein
MAPWRVQAAGGKNLIARIEVKEGRMAAGARLKRRMGLVIVAAVVTGGMVPAGTAQALPAGWRSLTGRLPDYVSIEQVLVSPDSRFAVLRADIEQDDRHELYSVSLAGGPLVKLNPPLVAGGEVDAAPLITADSSRVIFAADQEVDERVELFSVPITGGVAIKLNGPLVSGGNVEAFKLEGHSQRVVYLADQATNDRPELYSVPQAGGMFVKLNPALAQGGVHFVWRLDPSGARVVYMAAQDTPGLRELYSVPITGGPSVKLSPAGVTTEHVEVAPGAPYVLFLVRLAGSPIVQELYGNNTAGGTPLRRNFILGAGESVLNFRVSPSGAHVAYVVGPGGNIGSGNLWATSPFGGTSLRLSPSASSGFGVDFLDFQFALEGQRVVFGFQANASAQRRLKSADPAVGGLNNAVDVYVPGPGRLASVCCLSADGDWAVVVDFGGSSDYDLYAVPIAGGAPVPLGAANTARITPDSSRVIYVDFTEPAAPDMLSVQIFGGGLRNLSGLGPGEFVHAPLISPDGQAIVFEVTLDNGERELRVSDGAEAQPPMYDLYLPAVEGA